MRSVGRVFIASVTPASPILVGEKDFSVQRKAVWFIIRLKRFANLERERPQKITVIQIQGQISPGTVLGDLLTSQIPTTLIPTFAPSPLGARPLHGLCPAAQRPDSPSGEEEEVHQPCDDGGQQTPILEDLGQKGKRRQHRSVSYRRVNPASSEGFFPGTPYHSSFLTLGNAEMYVSSRQCDISASRGD